MLTTKVRACRLRIRMAGTQFEGCSILGLRRAYAAALGAAKAAATATECVACSFPEQRLHREQTNQSGNRIERVEVSE